MARVSVMIPTYNGASFLKQAIISVLNQAEADYEITVIDDASTDGTPDLVRSISGVRLLRNPVNLGLPKNFNRCLEEARSDYMCLFCQDDLMEPGNLASKALILDRHRNVGMAFSNTGFLDARGNREDRLWNYDIPPDSIIPGRSFLRRLILGDNPVSLSGAVFRTEWARQAGGFEKRFPQTLDWHLWMKLSLRSDIAYIGQPLTHYRHHPDTATLSQDPVFNIRDVYRSKIAFLRENWRCIPGAPLLEDQFRVHFGKGLLASAFRCAFSHDRKHVIPLLSLCGPLTPDPSFLPKAILLGTLQAFLRVHAYGSPKMNRNVPKKPL